jgi:hypothetical protein
MIRRVLALCLVGSLGALAAPTGCVGSAPVTSFRVTVQPPGNSTALRIRQVNNLPASARIAYRPLDLPADMKKDAKLTLVLVPVNPDGNVTVLEPKLAAAAGEWVTPFAARVVLLVFAPQGLDEKRLTNLVTKDEALVATLADYADETADLEAQLETARELEQEAEESDNRAARPDSPAEQALYSLVRALNPAVSGYDPLGTGRVAGPATLMGKGEEAFFENAGGLVPGGAVLPMVKLWLMPDTEFRSVYAIPTEQDGITLCTKLQTRQNHKIAYLWAYRMAGGSAPKVTLAKDVDVPMGMRATVPIKLDRTTDWRPVSRIFDWTLVPENAAEKPVPVAVRTAPDERALVLDLRRFAGTPGAYHLQGKWDWSTVKVDGAIRPRRLDDFRTARLTPDTQDKFVAATGTVPIELTGADFLFVDQAWLHRTTSVRQIPADLPVDRNGPSNSLRIEVNTDGLRPGPYLLALARVDGAVTDVPVRLLPAPPRVDTSGARVNIGDREERVTLAGSGLERIERINGDKADVVMQAANEDGSRREVAVRLHADAKPGDKLTLVAKVEGVAGAMRFPGVLQVAAARPRIREAKASIPADLAVTVREGEIPAGSWVSYILRVEPSGSSGSLTLQCAEPARAVQPVKLHVGEKQASAQLVATGDDGWFLSFDPGAAGQSGCTLTAVMDTEELGKSDPFTLGKVVRLPHIDSFAMTDEKSPDGFYGVLKGFDLDTIEKTGWDNRAGVAAPELPKPAAGEGSKQTLRIAMPWPSPSPRAPLYVWLRGETEGRATKVNP